MINKKPKQSKKKENKSKIQTYKVKNGVTKHYSEKDVKQAIDEMKKAKAVKVTEQEYQKEISGKMVERVTLQKNYQGAYLLRRTTEERLKDMQGRIKHAKLNKKKRVKWLGYEYGLDHIKSNYDYELHGYRQAISNENYLKQALVNVGFEDQDLIAVLNGKYISNHDVLVMKEKKKDETK